MIWRILGAIAAIVLAYSAYCLVLMVMSARSHARKQREQQRGRPLNTREREVWDVYEEELR